jgi:cyclic pyranopterin phosphate synthase
MTEKSLSHLDESGRARMVDVGDKAVTDRFARAGGRVLLSPHAFELAQAGDLKKGDLRAAAELAGVMAAKKTHELIPLCHPLQLSKVEVHVSFDPDQHSIEIESSVRCRGQTGVEMEALTAVSVAALTVYDMIKAVDKGARIEAIRLVEKRGGRSGDVVLE